MNSVTRTLTAMLVIALTSYVSRPAFAGGADPGGKKDRCCNGCGNKSDCCKVCRLVKVERELTETCWSSECEDFCVAGPSCKGCKRREPACRECGKGKCGCDAPKGDPKGGAKGGCPDISLFGLREGLKLTEKKFVWYDWIPGSARLHTRKKLLKKDVTKTVAGYKWVVEDLCGKCETKSQGADIDPGTQDLVPEPPDVDEARLKYGNPHNLPVRFTGETVGSDKEVAQVFSGLLK